MSNNLKSDGSTFMILSLTSMDSDVEDRNDPHAKLTMSRDSIATTVTLFCSFGRYHTVTI